VTAVLALAAALAAQAPADLVTWRLHSGRSTTDPGAPSGPLPVGSLVKPFLAGAWARSHPGSPAPRVLCDGRSGCWKPSGHGELGLARALAFSCNTYFKAMAAQTPAEGLARALRAEGFAVAGAVSPAAALGLDGGEDAPVIEPRALLVAYERLVARPWAAAEEPVRQEILAGLREGARIGTARGARALLGKTGTVPSLQGRPQRTSGWALAIEANGGLRLGLLRDGTGRQAAAALGTHAQGRPPAGEARGDDEVGATDRVRVRLLDALRPREVVVRSLAAAPVATSRGYQGPGRGVLLRPGDRLGDGLWELRLPGLPFTRTIRGRLEVDAAPESRLRLVADVTTDEYVAGVLLAELPHAEPVRRIELGAAILRFLAAGTRHENADVCDRTHCAWFVGRGPRVLWPTPVEPVLLREPGADRDRETAPLDAATWSRIRRAAREPGPHLWSSHCGGAPLSAHFVWGNGDRRVWSCARHVAPAASWSRDWPAAAIARAFGERVRSIDVDEESGMWSLRIRATGGEERLGFDEARRRLDAAVGRDALPSPAARVSRVTDGFRAEGSGLGHRVGFCLAN
jgi:stage II sporulation protein D